MLGLVPRLLVYNNSNVGRRSGGDPNFVNNIMNLIRDLEIDWGQDLNNNQAWKHWAGGLRIKNFIRSKDETKNG